MKMYLETLAVGPLQVNCYIIGCPVTQKALVVDPGDDAERIQEVLQRKGLQLQTIVNTHGHFDHVGGNRKLIELTGAELLIHAADAPFLPRVREHAAIYGLQVAASPVPTRNLSDGEKLTVGTLTLKVIHTPGHTPGGICLWIGEHLFAGDTLFADSVGRTDLPGGSHEELVTAIREKLFVLPATTIVHPGHGPETTIGHEKRHNPFVGDGIV